MSPTAPPKSSRSIDRQVLAVERGRRLEDGVPFAEVEGRGSARCWPAGSPGRRTRAAGRSRARRRRSWLPPAGRRRRARWPGCCAPAARARTARAPRTSSRAARRRATPSAVRPPSMKAAPLVARVSATSGSSPRRSAPARARSAHSAASPARPAVRFARASPAWRATIDGSSCMAGSSPSSSSAPWTTRDRGVGLVPEDEDRPEPSGQPGDPGPVAGGLVPVEGAAGVVLGLPVADGGLGEDRGPLPEAGPLGAVGGQRQGILDEREGLLLGMERRGPVRRRGEGGDRPDREEGRLRVGRPGRTRRAADPAGPARQAASRWVARATTCSGSPRLS